MTANVFDHPFLSGLLGDEIAGYFTAQADVRAMLSFEAALAKAQAQHGLVPAGAAARIAEICATFEPDIAGLKSSTAIDGMPVPGLIKQLRKAVGGDAAAHVHLGSTSQDVIDSSLMLRLKQVSGIFAARLAAISAAVGKLDVQFGNREMMGYTRMQAAIPITVADRLRAWREPLKRYELRLKQSEFPLQFGGAAGTLEKLGSKAGAVRAAVAQELGLADAPQWHTQRGVIADIANLTSLITGSLGKVGQDIALMAQSGGEIEFAGGGTSSAMPHKQNPIAAEVLVTLAQFNATQISGIHHAMLHEQERSGAAWTLEWMILPQMAIATGASLRLARELLANIKRLGKS